MTSRSRLLLVLACLVAVSSCLSAFAAYGHERARVELRAELAANQGADLLRASLISASTALNDEAAYFASSSLVTESDFSTYAGLVLGRSGLTGIGWIERVPRNDRLRFERENGAPIWERAVGQDSLRRAGIRAEYFPIARVASRLARSVARGTDVGTDPSRRQALRRTIESGEVSVSGLVRLYGGGVPGIVLYQAAFAPPRPGRTPGPRPLLGIASGSFTVDGLLAPLAAQASSIAVDIESVPLSRLPPGAESGPRIAVAFGGETFGVTAVKPRASVILPWVILIAGAAMTTLAFALWIVVARRDRAQRAAIDAATAELRASQSSQRAMLENSSDVIARYDRDLRCRYANTAIQAATGRPPAEFIGRTLVEMDGPPGLLEKWTTALGGVFATGEGCEFSFQYELPSGRHSFAARVDPEPGPNGRIETVLVTTRDVTAHVAARRALEASELRYRTLVASMAGGVVLQSATGHIEDCNPAACRILGLSRDQLLGRVSMDPRWRAVRRDGTPLAGEEHPTMVTLATGRSLRGEIIGVHRPDGSLVWLSVATELLERVEGQAVVATFTDVTAQMDAEREQATLRRLATLVASDAEPRRVFDAIAHEAAVALGGEAAGVLRFDEARTYATLMGARIAMSDHSPAFGLRLDLDRATAAGEVAQTGEAARVGDGCDGPVHPNLLMPDVPISAAVAAPIAIDGDVWGALAVATTESRAFSPDAEGRLARLAEIASLAISSSDARAQLATLASTDDLTGLWNRRAFQERLSAELERARRHDRTLSLVVMDIDHFKLVNDTHGHPVGDRVLIEVARRLFSLARTGEIVARVGGEEFAWILPETDGGNATLAAERVRQAIMSEPFETVGPLTISVGVCDLAEADDGNELFRLADVALYRAKAQGRNRVFRYSSQTIELLPADEHRRRLGAPRASASVHALAAAVDTKDPSRT